MILKNATLFSGKRQRYILYILFLNPYRPYCYVFLAWKLDSKSAGVGADISYSHLPCIDDLHFPNLIWRLEKISETRPAKTIVVDFVSKMETVHHSHGAIVFSDGEVTTNPPTAVFPKLSLIS